MKVRAVHLILSAALLSACATDKGFNTADVTPSDFEARWPFSADSGTLACEPGGVPTFTADGSTVRLDDPELSEAAWSDSATLDQVSFFRDEARSLCD